MYRRWMLNAVKNELVPRLGEQEFERVFLKGEEKKQLEQFYPFGKFQRFRGDVVDILEIQFPQYGYPEFRIGAGTVAKSGYEHQIFGYIAAKDVWVGYLIPYYSFYAIPFTGRWFSVPFYSFRKLNEEDFSAYVVALCGCALASGSYVRKISAALVNEINEALIHDRRGKHTRKCG